MKRMLFLLLLIGSFGYCLAGNPSVNELSLKSFNALFKNAQNISWVTDAKFSDVSFQENGMLMKARFDNAGNLIRMIRYYGEQELPAFVAERIKQQYKNCEIYGVTELAMKESLSYTCSIRNKKYLFIVHTDINGEVLSAKKYNRSDPGPF